MPDPCLSDSRPADTAAALARVALQAAATVSAQRPSSEWHSSARPSWCGPDGALPGYVPVFASPDWTSELLRRTDRVLARHRAMLAEAPNAAAPELAAAGVHIYAEKVTKAVPGRAPLELWEEVARFGASAVVASARSLAAAVLTARATAQWPQHARLLEAVRRHWLVDWTRTGDDLFPAGPADHPQMLSALGAAIDACADLGLVRSIM